MKVTRDGKRYILDNDEGEKMCSSGEKSDEHRGKALLRVMRAINKIEKRLELRVTDFSDFLDKDEIV